MSGTPADTAIDAFVAASSMKVGEQLDTLTTYVTIRQLFPQITLEHYLQRLTETKNMKLPVDALETYCPPKRNGFWTPTKRLEVVRTYLRFLSLMPPNEPVMAFEDFVIDEAASLTGVAPVVPAFQPTLGVKEFKIGPGAGGDTVVTPVVPAAPVQPAISVAAATPITPPPAVELPPTDVVVPPDGVLHLDARARAELLTFLQRSTPVDNVGAGIAMIEHKITVEGGTVVFALANGEVPYLDVYFTDPAGQPVAEIPPIDKHTATKDGVFVFPTRLELKYGSRIIRVDITG
jgi:hypothetical protein